MLIERKTDSEEASRIIRRVTWIGLIINIALSVFKFAAGVIGNSQAVTADAVHSLSDSSTDVAVIIGSRFWSKPPDQSHPYGHRRIETLITVFIGVVLLAAGIGIAWDAAVSAYKNHPARPGWIAFCAAVTSFFCKELLYRWTVKVGKNVRSPALRANAWHHRLDAISSVPAIIAVLGAIYFPSMTFLDSIGAVIVAILIIQAALKIVWPGLMELIDAGAPEEACERIKEAALKNKTVKKVGQIRTRYVSNALQVDLYIIVDGSISVLEGHQIAEDVRERIIMCEEDVLDVMIHVDPIEIFDEDDSCIHV